MFLNETLLQAFAGFLSDVPTRRLRHNLELVLFDFFKRNYAEGFPDFVDDLFTDLTPFFDFLEIIDREVDQSDLLR